MTDVIDRLLESRLFCYCFCCWAMLCIIFIYGQLLPTRQMDYWFLEKTLNLSEVTFSESPNIFVFINFLIFSCTFSSYVVAQDASIIIKRVFDFSQKYAHYQCNQNKTQQNQKQWINDQDKKKTNISTTCTVLSKCLLFIAFNCDWKCMQKPPQNTTQQQNKTMTKWKSEMKTTKTTKSVQQFNAHISEQKRNTKAHMQKNMAQRNGQEG